MSRFDYGTAAPGVYEAMDGVDRYFAQSSIESSLLFLVQLRASQVNGCAYCLNLHWRDLRRKGESEQRL
jgi:alkylhydroperoxidase family enzyme